MSTVFLKLTIWWQAEFAWGLMLWEHFWPGDLQINTKELMHDTYAEMLSYANTIIANKHTLTWQVSAHQFV